MLTLLGTLLGFASSTIPDFLKILKDKEDRKHQLAMLDIRLRAEKESISLEADAAESTALYAHDSKLGGVKWVDGLRASVRPVITYAFFILFSVVKVTTIHHLSAQGVGITDALIAVWDEETQVLFAAVISFWFGQRSMARLGSRIRDES